MRRRLLFGNTEMVITMESYDFGTSLGSVDVTVAARRSWSALSVQDGFSLSQTSGEAGETVVTVTRTDNTSSGSWTLILVDIDNNVATFTFYYSTPSYLTVEPSSHDFGTETGNVEITVDSSSAWEATGVPEDMELDVTSGEAGKTVINLTRNSTSLDGTAVITFKNEDGDEATLEVTREKVTYLTLSNSTLAFGSSTSQLNFTLDSSSAWKATLPTGFSLNKSSGDAGCTRLTLTCSISSTSAGSATLVFTNDDGIEVTLPIIYTARYISVSPTSCKATETQSSSGMVTVTSSSAWTASGIPDDVQLSATSGSSGTTTIYVTKTTSSTGMQSLSATITFKNSTNNSCSLYVDVNMS